MTLDATVLASLKALIGLHEPITEQVARLTADEAHAVLAFTATVFPGPAKTENDLITRRRVIQYATRKTLYLRPLPPKAWKVTETRRFLQAQQEGFTVDCEPPLTVRASGEQTVMRMATYMDRFRAHAQGITHNHLQRSMTQEQPAARSLHALVPRRLFLTMLRHAPSAKVRAILWLSRSLAGTLTEKAGIHCNDITFRTAYRVARIILRNDDAKPHRIVFVARGAWALRTLLLELRAKPRDCLLLDANGRPMTAKSLARAIEILMRKKALQKELADQDANWRRYDYTASGLQDAALVDAMRNGMHPFVAGALTGRDPPSVVPWYRAAKAEAAQRHAAQQEGTELTERSDAWPTNGCLSCGDAIIDGACRRCHMPIDLYAETAAEQRRARLRQRFDRILDLRGPRMDRNTAAMQANDELATLWSNP